MKSNFYNENGPIPFDGFIDEEPELPKKKRHKLLFSSNGMLAPMGYVSGQVYPFYNPVLVEEEEVEVDPNP